MTLDDRRGVGRGERAGPGEQPEQRARQRILIRPMVQRRTGELLGRRVSQCGGKGSGLREMARVVPEAGDTEVGEVHPLAAATTAARQQDVRGLHVAVQHTDAVRVVEGVRGFLDDLHGALGRQRLRLHRCGVDAVDELHGDPQLLGLEPAVVDRDDIRVVELGDQIRLPFEPRPHLLVEEHLPVQQLQRGQARQPRVFRQVDRSHATATQLPLDDITGENVTAGQHVCSTSRRPPGPTDEQAYSIRTRDQARAGPRKTSKP